MSIGVLAAVPGTVAAGTCSITSVSPVVFGAYDVFDPDPVDSTGAITIECSDVGVADTVRLELDGGAASGFAPRTLIGGAVGLAYNLYLDAGRSAVWGDGTGGSAPYGPLRPDEGTTTIPVYGRVPAGQDVPAGAYADTVTVTLQF